MPHRIAPSNAITSSAYQLGSRNSRPRRKPPGRLQKYSRAGQHGRASSQSATDTELDPSVRQRFHPTKQTMEGSSGSFGFFMCVRKRLAFTA